MTFPFQPQRASSDDDALDQQLNDWVSGELQQRHSEPVDGTLRCSAALRPPSVESPREAHPTTTDALEFHRWADDTRRTDPAATGPAAGTWNRVLRNSAQASPKGSGEMSTAVLSSQPHGYGKSSAAAMGESVRHYSRLVATIAIVFAIAAGGWFAMSQMPEGGGDGRFAAFQGTPEVAQSQTCDVEPLTVDEVMKIVKNPYMAYDPENITSRDQLRVWEENTKSELVETIYPVVDQLLLDGFTYPASNMGFEDAVDSANGFLSCAQFGTVGQIFNYFDPREVQRIALSVHPVFRDEASVRASVEQLLESPGGNLVFPGRPNLEATDLTLTINPESENALVAMGTPATRYEATRVMMLGIVATDSEGNIVYQSNAEGDASPSSGLDRASQFRVIMKQSSIDGKWYNLATWPEILYVN